MGLSGSNLIINQAHLDMANTQQSSDTCFSLIFTFLLIFVLFFNQTKIFYGASPPPRMLLDVKSGNEQAISVKLQVRQVWWHIL